MGKQKVIKLYDGRFNYIKTFGSTKECAEFFNKSVSYIIFNLNHCSKIKKGDEWFILTR